jgi:thiosulfate dehydrogenase
MKRTILITIIIAVCAFLVGTGQSANAEDISRWSQEKYERVINGGLLYDKWYKILNVKTEGTHPSYPPEGKKKGASTWRCKECHGWDYQGSKGAYAKGSHFTGIKGIRDSAGKNPNEITAVLKDKTHAFGSRVPDESYTALAYFVAYGQVDMDTIIDRKTKKVSGDYMNGAKIYFSTCAKCHGADGRKINFKTHEKPVYLGTAANKNPWETLHKMRFGQPKTQMSSMLFLDMKDQLDLLSYCQALPVE